MKLEIKIDTAIVEPETVITTSAMTDEVNRVVNYTSNLENTSFMITGQKDGKIELLDQENIIRYFAIFFVIFVIVWISQYFMWKKRIGRINDKLHEEK